MVIRRNAEKLYIELLKAIRRNGGVECEQYPDIFIAPEDTDRTTYQQDYRFTRMICGRCPSKDLCADYAIESYQTHGMWGGMTPQDIRKAFTRRFNYDGKAGRPRLNPEVVAARVEQRQAEESWSESDFGPMHLSSGEGADWDGGDSIEVLAWGEDWDSDAPLY